MGAGAKTAEAQKSQWAVEGQGMNSQMQYQQLEERQTYIQGRSTMKHDISFSTY